MANGGYQQLSTALLVTWQGWGTQVEAKRFVGGGSGANWGIGTRFGAAQMGLPVRFVVLVPWLVVLSWVEPVGIWSSTSTSSMTWRFA